MREGFILMIFFAMFFSGGLLNSQESRGVKIGRAPGESRNFNLGSDNQYALIIGIDKYDKVGNLRNAVFDARELKKVLIERYKYRAENIRELWNEAATQRNILAELRWVVNNLKSNHNLLVYFSGHGHWQKEFDMGFWLASDVGTDFSPQEQSPSEDEIIDLSSRKISNEFVKGMMKQCKAKHIFVIADACFSGQLLVRAKKDANDIPSDYFKKKSRQVLASGREREKVSDGPPGKHSPFALYFLKYLKENTSKYIIAKKMIVDVETAVKNNAYQTPVGGVLHMAGDEGGEFLFPYEYYENVKKMQTVYHSLLRYLDLPDQTRKAKLNQCRGFLRNFQVIPESGDDVENIRRNVEEFITKFQNEIRLIHEMKNKYEALTLSLKKENTDFEEKIKRCNQFLEDFEKAPADKSVKKIRSEINGYIGIYMFENMQNDFKKLVRSTRAENVGLSSLEQIIKNCEAFLEKHKSVPNTAQKEVIFAEVKTVKSDLKDKIQRIKNKIEKDFENLEMYLKRGDVKPGDKLKQCEAFLNTHREIPFAGMREKIENRKSNLKEGIERAKLSGKEIFEDLIKRRVTLEQFLGFKRRFPGSPYIDRLKERLRSVEKTLPPETSWEAITKNRNGYYELEVRGHIMIYLPGKRFWIDKYEVSNGQYRKFLEKERPVRQTSDNRYILSGDEYPVVVEYKSARKYCRMNGFRLPTEAEWEYAAGKGTYLYPWGDELPSAGGTCRANFDSMDGRGMETDGFTGTAPVKTFEQFASIFGLVNMAGNVWEWVEGNVLKGGGIISEEKDLKIETRAKGKNGLKKGLRCIMDEV